MTLAQLTSAIDQAAACGVESVYFEGGEPTLAYPIVLAAAAHARAPRPRVGHGEQLLLGDVGRGRQGLAGAVRRARHQRPLAVVLRLLRRGRRRGAACATPCWRRGSWACRWACSRSARAGLPRRPGLCLGEDVGEIMYKGRAAVELAPGRAARPPETLVTCPSRTSPTPAAPTSAATASCSSARASAPATCSPAATAPAPADRRPAAGGLAAVLEATTRHGGRSSREILAGGPWALAQAYRPHAAARALRRRVPPLLRSALGPARALSPRCSRRPSATASRPRRRGAPEINQREGDDAVGVRTVLGARHVRRRRPPGQQEALPQDHLRRAEGAGQDRLRHRPRQRRGRGRQGLPRLRHAAGAGARPPSSSCPRKRRPRGSPRPPTPASRRSGSTR